MVLPQVRRITVEPADLALLPGWNFADCYVAPTTRADLTARQAARLMFEAQPAWIAGLMRLRNTLVRPLGLKTTGGGTDSVGAFPVIAETPGRLVMGFDDRHLDFVVVIEVRAGAEVRLSTIVRMHGALGRAYLAAVMPFHVLIVCAVLAQPALARSPSTPVAPRRTG